MSYGTDAPMGFQEETPLLSHTSNSSNVNYTIVSGYATAIFNGDPVARLTGTAVANTGITTTGANIQRATAGTGNAVCGVFQGVTFSDSLGNTQYLPYWPAATTLLTNTSASAHVIDDPFAEFNVQVSTSDTNVHLATLNFADLGKNANFRFGTAGNTRTGFSGATIDMATVAAGATIQCNLLRLTGGFGSTVIGAPGTATSQQNAFGTLYNNVVVTFNNHSQKGGTGTVGV
jgi:hypothetical protein